MIMGFKAIINVPGYLSNQDELPEFDTCMAAWEYLLAERLRDLDDPMNDEDDQDDDGALDELAGMIYDPKVGTVYGTTPGYDGDYDQGLAYSVIMVTSELINDFETDMC
jgi:hypothetical protein